MQQLMRFLAQRPHQELFIDLLDIGIVVRFPQLLTFIFFVDGRNARPPHFIRAKPRRPPCQKNASFLPDFYFIDPICDVFLTHDKRDRDAIPTTAFHLQIASHSPSTRSPFAAPTPF